MTNRQAIPPCVSARGIIAAVVAIAGALALVGAARPAAVWARGVPALRVSVPVAEPGDRIAFAVTNGGGACNLTVTRTPAGAPIVRRRIVHRVATTLPSSARAGTYRARVRCGRRTATASLIIHARSGPDFALSFTEQVTHDARRAEHLLTVTATNTAPWPATSVRLCVSASSGAVVTRIKAPGFPAGSGSACTLTPQIRPGANTRVAVQMRIPAAKGVRVTGTVSGSNSVSRRQGWTWRPSRLAGAHALPDGTTEAATTPVTQGVHALQTVTSCTPSSAGVGVVFVADDSGSMAENDPANLRGQAIAVGLDQLPNGSQAGAIRFSDVASTLFAPAAVTDAGRAAMKVTTDDLESDGGTSYDDAFSGAQGQLSSMSAALRRAVVFLSDGAPNDVDFTGDRAIAAQGIPIFTVGFGSADDAVLGGIAARSGGQAYTADSADDLQSVFARIIAMLTCSAPSVRTEAALRPSQTMDIPFAIAPEDGQFQALAAWSGAHVAVSMIRPDASVLTAGARRSGEQFSDNPTYALITGRNPASGTWTMRLTASADNLATVRVSIDVFKKSLPTAPTPVLARSDGRDHDRCGDAYGPVRQTVKKVLLGTQTTWDRASSWYFVCNGFGQETGFKSTAGWSCAFIAAGAVLIGGETADASVQAMDTLCNAASTLQELQGGNWGGVVKEKACEAFGSVFSEAAGVAIAGATLNPAFGIVSYRAFSAGFKLICYGTFGGGFADWGHNLETHHEVNIARDITSNGKCLRETVRTSQYTSWSASDCP